MLQLSEPASAPTNPIDAQFQDVRMRDVVMATLTITGVALAFLLLYRFAYILLSVIIAIMLYLAVRPLVALLNRIGVNKRVGMLVGYALMVGVVVGFLFLLIPMLLAQVRMITARLPEYYALIKQLFIQSDIALLQLVNSYLPAELNLERLPQLLMTPPEGTTNAAAPSPTALSLHSIIAGTFLVVAIFAMAFYWMRDRDKIIYQFLLLFPASQREGMEALLEEVEQKIGWFYQGQLLLCTVVGGVSFVAYWLVGLPYALTLGVIAFLFEAVPLIGPLLGAIPAVLLALTISPTMTLIVILINAVIQFLENNILVPRIMDRTVGVNPILTVLAIAGFTTLLGLPGALLAVPLAAILQLLFERTVFRLRTTETVNESATTMSLPGVRERNVYSVLRTEAQALAQDVRKQLRMAKATVSAESIAIEEMIEACAVEVEQQLAQQEVTATGKRL